jgi:hypothetical protein
MALILLPDVCGLPNKASGGHGKGKAEPETAKPLQVTKSSSATSLSSASSNVSKASNQSNASSLCSFAPLQPSTDQGGRTRIAICGAW